MQAQASESNRRDAYAESDGGCHVEPRSGNAGQALRGLTALYRHADASPTHRLFAWQDSRNAARTSQIIVFARQDDYDLRRPPISLPTRSGRCGMGTWLGVGNDPALHAFHHLRDLPFPREPDPRHSLPPTTPTIRAPKPLRQRSRELNEKREASPNAARSELDRAPAVVAGSTPTG